MKKIQGELIWYSLDHWSEVLDLDVASLHLDEQHRIRYLPGAKGFLEAVAAHDINVLMVTNSHQHTLDIKAAVTGITDYFDGIYTSHELGYAKEDQPFWHALQDQVDFDCAKTVLYRRQRDGFAKRQRLRRWQSTPHYQSRHRPTGKAKR